MAVASLAQLVRAFPSCPEGLVALSLALVRAGKPDAAAEALRRARFLAPQLAALVPSPSAAALDAPTLRSALHRLLGHEPAADSSNGALLPVPVEIPAAVMVMENPDPGVETAYRPYWAISTAPVGAPVRTLEMLPDGWAVAQQSLNLWMRGAARWAAPLAVLNFAAALWNVGSSAMSQALPWALAMALGAPVTLRAMARQWAPKEEEAVAVWPRFGAGQLWSALLLVGAAFVGLTPSTIASWFGGVDLLVVGMVVWLPLLGLLAPALMTLVAEEVPRAGSPTLLALLWRRGLLYAGLVSAVGSVGGLILAGLALGFLAVLNISDESIRRLVLGIGASLPQSLILALVAGCGMDALTGGRSPDAESSAFAYNSRFAAR
jgi:hypothetical protein